MTPELNYALGFASGVIVTGCIVLIVVALQIKGATHGSKAPRDIASDYTKDDV